jgi:hypothetical protein
MIKKITIIGCGNIGSRHLQAIAKLKSVEIHIVEPNKKAKSLAKSRLKEISNMSDDNLFWYENILELKIQSDLTIVSTPASGRLEIINRLLNLGHSRFLIEKMVCQSSNEYKSLNEQMQLFNAKGWVNVSRRYFISYQNIKNLFQNNVPIHMSIIGGNFGLGSNALHFIDLFSWFTGDYKIKLNGDLLTDKILPNKRGDDFVEFAGMIVGNSSNNSTFVINSLPFDIPITINIINNEHHLIINETNNQIYDITNSVNNLKFQTEYVSDTSEKIIHDILENDNCELPTIQNLSYIHSELFEIFNQHIYKITGIKKTLCPIT